jgi:hypothetical protein
VALGGSVLSLTSPAAASTWSDGTCTITYYNPTHSVASNRVYYQSHIECNREVDSIELSFTKSIGSTKGATNLYNKWVYHDCFGGPTGCYWSDYLTYTGHHWYTNAVEDSYYFAGVHFLDPRKLSVYL